MGGKRTSLTRAGKKLTLGTLMIIILVCLIIVWVYINFMASGESNILDSLIALISTVTAAVSAVLVVVQLRDTKRIQEAEFIISLNQSFVDNAGYARMYSELEAESKGERKADLSTIEISNYLTFFETVYLLLQDGIINMSLLNDLFSYRFFLAVHNETVQKLKLVAAPNNFRNIYYLEHIWMDYRRKKGFSIHREENRLEIACKNAKPSKQAEYEAIMASMDEKVRR